MAHSFSVHPTNQLDIATEQLLEYVVTEKLSFIKRLSELKIIEEKVVGARVA